ncbi:MAG: 1,4-alpha-glucan branching protein GlgB [Actinobacteria bacterium]|nr:1,4-alpha-glucan branching protein GlgB [Actinomycetota bacterium]
MATRTDAPTPTDAPDRDAPAPDVEGAGATSILTDFDLHLFNEGSHFNIHDKLGAHLRTVDGVDGAHFAVWAPNAETVSVIGDFNGWDKTSHPMAARGSSGIWELFVPQVGQGDTYKFHIRSRHRNYTVDKADPFAVHTETPPFTGSKIWDLSYEWDDAEWMAAREAHQALDRPMSIYEMHLGSWRRVPDEGDDEHGRALNYDELADPLIQHLRRMSFTHVEFMPVMEHPFGGSWGYQSTGYFAPTSRFGTPQDFKRLVDRLHQAGFGVIIDWVPSHFPSDEHGLAYFDGTHLFEHADPRKGYHPDWSSYIFNYGRHEVVSFLLSSALFWLREYHIDGIRVDAVASMLYLDYSRKDGEWIPNDWGGNENVEAITFLRRFNEEIYRAFPGVQTLAEESTAWPMVSRPTYVGGLGFGMKWDMGWMHDTLSYFQHDPIHRKYHHNELTFRAIYAFSENYCLPLSHDEVVHGKGSMIGKMPGDDWQKFANLRALYGYMFASPGKKLLFMGGEFGQWQEWSHERSLDWHLLDGPLHSGLLECVGDLGRLYRDEPAMHDGDVDPAGWEWIDASDWEQSVVAFLRRTRDGSRNCVVVLNLTPVVRQEHRVGLPVGGHWSEVFNSDDARYGGSGQGNHGGVDAEPMAYHGRDHSAPLTLPPLSVVILRADEIVTPSDDEAAGDLEADLAHEPEALGEA